MDHLSLINLTNFRNLSDETIDFSDKINLFVGQNGSGKTNILESISLFSPGKGIKKQPFDRMKKLGQDDSWVIFSKYQKKNNIFAISATYLKKDNGTLTKKILINGEKPIKLKESDKIPTVLWFIPEMERLFIGPPSLRRNFIDKIVYSFDFSIASKINYYTKLIKERSMMLQKNNFDKNWLNIIEEKIATTGLEIIMKRNNTIKLLNEMFSKIYFKKNNSEICKIKLIGNLENMLLKDGYSNGLEKYIKELKNTREEDTIKGGCKIGPHKSDIEIVYLNNNVDAVYCSTGQQKEIILNILLCQCYCLINVYNINPIILLDEICSHLDERTGLILLELAEWLKIQLFITGTENNLFSFLRKKSKFFNVINGKVSY